jgi:hypothetical protein
VGFQESNQCCSVDDQAFRLGEGLRIRTSQRIVLQRAELAESVTGPQYREDHLTSTLGGSGDLHLPPGDDEELVAWVAFAKDVGVAREPPPPDLGQERGKVSAIDPFEQARSTQQRQGLIWMLRLRHWMILIQRRPV